MLEHGEWWTSAIWGQERRLHRFDLPSCKSQVEGCAKKENMESSLVFEHIQKHCFLFVFKAIHLSFGLCWLEFTDASN